MVVGVGRSRSGDIAACSARQVHVSGQRRELAEAGVALRRRTMGIWGIYRSTY